VTGNGCRSVAAKRFCGHRGAGFRRPRRTIGDKIHSAGMGTDLANEMQGANGFSPLPQLPIASRMT